MSDRGRHARPLGPSALCVVGRGLAGHAASNAVLQRRGAALGDDGRRRGRWGAARARRPLPAPRTGLQAALGVESISGTLAGLVGGLVALPAPRVARGPRGCQGRAGRRDRLAVRGVVRSLVRRLPRPYNRRSRGAGGDGHPRGRRSAVKSIRKGEARGAREQ